MFIADSWKDYELIDCGGGEKYERWGDVFLLRPDPQAVWPMYTGGYQIDAHYTRSEKGGGEWKFFRKVPESWTINWNELKFRVRPTGFKHTGLFPEQAVNWEWMQNRVKLFISKHARAPKILNLFAYTGGATLAALSAGAEVTHLDAAKGMVAWAKENAITSGLADGQVRWLIDDALKFVYREARRSRKYDGILMDPPSYGRGPGGEMWKIEDSLYEMIDAAAAILSEDANFFLINSYTTGLASSVLENIINLRIVPQLGGSGSSEEIGIPAKKRGIVLPCGSSGRWEG